MHLPREIRIERESPEVFLSRTFDDDTIHL